MARVARPGGASCEGCDRADAHGVHDGSTAARQRARGRPDAMGRSDGSRFGRARARSGMGATVARDRKGRTAVSLPAKERHAIAAAGAAVVVLVGLTVTQYL